MSSFELLSDPKYCGKMKVMEKLLRVFKEEHSKLLVFSRSTQVCLMQLTSYSHFCRGEIGIKAGRLLSRKKA